MSKRNILYFILSLDIIVRAQNLVINPSFEQHSQCPNASSQINYCNSWYNGSIQSTVDYFSANGCTGNFSPPIIHTTSYLTFYHQPLSGKSFVGIIPYISNTVGREFLKGGLVSPLSPSNLYYVEFYIGTTSQQEFFLHDMTALLTDTSGLVDQYHVQNYSPQILPLAGKIYTDTVKWMRINGFYTANGGESYITIGNFTPYGHELKDSILSCPYQYAYYFIDSVGVYPVTHIDAWDAGPDKYINLGDSTQIGNLCSDYSMFDWVTSISGITYLSDSTMPQIWSKPPITTTYYVTKTQGTNVFQDTVTVFVTNTAGLNKFANNTWVKVYPNPANNKIYIDTKEIEIIKLNDLLGNEILSTKEKELDISNTNNGVYFVQVKTKENTSIQKIIVQH